MRPNGQCSARSSAICIAHSRRGVSALSSANLRSARSNGPAILLQGLCALVAIAMVHCNSRLTCAIALAIFAIGIAVSVLLIVAYSRPSRANSRSGRSSSSRSSPPSPPDRMASSLAGVNHSPTRQRPFGATYGKLQSTLRQRHLRGRPPTPSHYSNERTCLAEKIARLWISRA